MSKKPKQVESQEIQEEILALKDESDSLSIEYTDTTYCPVWNETFKRYDMLTIRINRNSEKCFVDRRESTRYDTSHRALHDLLQRLTTLFVKGEK